MTDLLAANFTVSTPSLGNAYVIPDEGPLFALPRNGEVFLGIDANGHETRVWFANGQVLSEAAFPVYWWRRQQ